MPPVNVENRFAHTPFLAMSKVCNFTYERSSREFVLKVIKFLWRKIHVTVVTKALHYPFNVHSSDVHGTYTICVHVLGIMSYIVVVTPAGLCRDVLPRVTSMAGHRIDVLIRRGQLLIRKRSASLRQTDVWRHFGSEFLFLHLQKKRDNSKYWNINKSSPPPLKWS